MRCPEASRGHRTGQAAIYSITENEWGPVLSTAWLRCLSLVTEICAGITLACASSFGDSTDRQYFEEPQAYTISCVGWNDECCESGGLLCGPVQQSEAQMIGVELSA